jgi:hypothetical protein
MFRLCFFSSPSQVSVPQSPLKRDLAEQTSVTAMQNLGISVVALIAIGYLGSKLLECCSRNFNTTQKRDLVDRVGTVDFYTIDGRKIDEGSPITEDAWRVVYLSSSLARVQRVKSFRSQNEYYETFYLDSSSNAVIGKIPLRDSEFEEIGSVYAQFFREAREIAENRNIPLEEYLRSLRQGEIHFASHCCTLIKTESGKILCFLSSHRQFLFDRESVEECSYGKVVRIDLDKSECPWSKFLF